VILAPAARASLAVAVSRPHMDTSKNSIMGDGVSLTVA
jgi:hypothetical protein